MSENVDIEKQHRLFLLFFFMVYSWFATVSCPMRERKADKYFPLKGCSSSWEKIFEPDFPLRRSLQICLPKTGRPLVFACRIRWGRNISLSSCSTPAQKIWNPRFFPVIFDDNECFGLAVRRLCFFLFIYLFIY